MKLGQSLGLAAEDLIGDDITPVMVAARIWRKDAAALKRLTEQSQIESGHAYCTWRAASDEVPTYTAIREPSLRRWEKHIAGEFFKRGLGDGVRIFVHTVDDYVFFLIRHGCSPRRDITHEKGADTGNVLYRPSRTDIVYDISEWDVGPCAEWDSFCSTVDFTPIVFFQPPATHFQNLVGKELPCSFELTVRKGVGR